MIIYREKRMDKGFKFKFQHNLLLNFFFISLTYKNRSIYKEHGEDILENN